MTGGDAILRRRGLIVTRPHPGAHHDCLVTLSTPLAPGLDLTLCYVPDRVIIAGTCWRPYAAALDPAAAPEALAVTVLDDVNNEIVPRWVQVVIERTGDAPDIGVTRHRIMIEDAQPGWDDSGILARL